jgi:PP-loop superfamily ATP-utilizing enzyme
MHPLEKKTLKILKQEHLLQTREKVVIGVSGGPDSMALLHVLARLAPILDITLAAVYVNHGLRPGWLLLKQIDLELFFFPDPLMSKAWPQDKNFPLNMQPGYCATIFLKKQPMHTAPRKLP